MIWSLQILRFIAALMIVYLHAAVTANYVTGSSGFIPKAQVVIFNSGVDIFFVISGVIITKIARGSTPSAFIFSRLKRIVPMYFICTIPFLATGILTGFGWRDALATFLFWPATDRMTAPVLPVGWTLCFEMLFYISTALVLVHRYWLVAIIGAYAAALALRPIGATFQFLGNPIILEFFLGAIIACTPVWRLGAWAVPCGVVMLACAGIIGVAPVGGALPALRGDEGFWRVLIYGVPAAMIVYGTLQVNTRESVWTYLGSASYSLYLVHIPILLVMLILWRTYSVPPDLIIIFGISTSLLFSWQIHERFEKPIAFYLRYRLRQRLSETRVAGRQSQIAVRSIGLRKVAPPQPALRERDTTMLGVGPAEPFL